MNRIFAAVFSALLVGATGVGDAGVTTGGDGRDGSWMEIGNEDHTVIINNAGMIGIHGCTIPRVQTVGDVVMVDCGPVFSTVMQKSVKSIREATRRTDPLCPERLEASRADFLRCLDAYETAAVMVARLPGCACSDGGR